MKLNLETHVKAPIDAVFAAFSDIENSAANIEGIDRVEMLTDGPVGKGTRFRETRTMFGKEATEEMEITQFDPPKSYTVEADSCGSHFTSVISFVEKDGGTLVTMAMTSKANTFMAKLMTPLGFLFAGAAKKAMRGDFEDLKKHIETQY